MVPTLQVRDVLLVNEIAYRLHRPADGDIAVFEPPVDSGGSDFVKRVIGVPGDTIAIRDGVVYRDGAALREPYENQPPNYDLDDSRLRHLRRRPPARSARRQRSAARGVAGARPNSNRILFRPRRQSELLRRLARLGICANAWRLRRRTAKRAQGARRLHGTCLRDYLAAEPAASFGEVETT